MRHARQLSHRGAEPDAGEQDHYDSGGIEELTAAPLDQVEEAAAAADGEPPEEDEQGGGEVGPVGGEVVGSGPVRHEEERCGDAGEVQEVDDPWQFAEPGEAIHQGPAGRGAQHGEDGQS